MSVVRQSGWDVMRVYQTIYGMKFIHIQFSIPCVQLLKKSSARQISKTASPLEHFRQALQQVSYCRIITCVNVQFTYVPYQIKISFLFS